MQHVPAVLETGFVLPLSARGKGSSLSKRELPRSSLPAPLSPTTCENASCIEVEAYSVKSLDRTVFATELATEILDREDWIRHPNSGACCALERPAGPGFAG